MAKKKVTPRKTKPRMHTFSKEIVKAGRYLTTNPDGTRSYKEVTKEDLETAVESFNEMKERGLKVPAPWKHDFNVTVDKIVEGDNGVLEDSTKNAGFWTEVSLEDDENGVPTLNGKIQAPGNPNDPETPAGKIGTTVQDTSIYMKRNYELTDDSGVKLDNALMHIALVANPIEPGQKNFELEDKGSEAIAMSQDNLVICMSQYLEPSDLSGLSILLDETVGIYLPAGTTMDNLVSNLMIALEQCKLSKKDDESNSPSKNDNSFTMEPVVMGNMSKEQIQAIMDSKAVNPSTGKPFEASDFGEGSTQPEQSQVDVSQNPVVMGLANTLKATNQSSFRNRVNGLIESRRVTKEYADSNLFPKIDNYSLSFSESGQVEEDALESIIMGLESVQPPAASKEDDLIEELNPNHDPDTLSDEEMNSIANDLMGIDS